MRHATLLPPLALILAILVLAPTPKAAAQQPHIANHVWIMGDESASDLGNNLLPLLPPTRVSTRIRFVPDAGLADDGYQEWRQALSRMARDRQPQHVILSLGRHDAKTFTGNSLAWQLDYALRVQTVLDAISRAAPTAHIVWLGAPHTDPATCALNNVIQDQCTRTPHATFLDTTKSTPQTIAHTTLDALCLKQVRVSELE